MIKKNLIKLHSWLLMNHVNNQLFEKYVRYQLIDILEWFIYPEFRKINWRQLLKNNKIIVIVIISFIFWTTGLFSIGRWLSFSDKAEKIYSLESKLEEINNILYNSNVLLDRKDSTITQLRETMGSREYLQFIIKRDCNLTHYQNLVKLPDDIFFTMIDEIEKYKIPYTIFFRVVDHESGFQFIVNSAGSGAFGYCQVMPATFNLVAKKLGFKEHNQITNIKAGAFLLRDAYDRHRKRGNDVRTSWFNSLVEYSGGDTQLAQSELRYFKSDF